MLIYPSLSHHSFVHSRHHLLRRQLRDGPCAAAAGSSGPHAQTAVRKSAGPRQASYRSIPPAVPAEGAWSHSFPLPEAPPAHREVRGFPAGWRLRSHRCAQAQGTGLPSPQAGKAVARPVVRHQRLLASCLAHPSAASPGSGRRVSMGSSRTVDVGGSPGFPPNPPSQVPEGPLNTTFARNMVTTSSLRKTVVGVGVRVGETADRSRNLLSHGSTSVCHLLKDSR